MAELLTIDDTAIIGGPARLLAAASTYPLPNQISEIVSLSTYLPNSTYGWQDIGATEVGITMTREVSEKEWRTDQFGLLKTLPLDWKSTVATRAMQTTQANKALLMAGSAGSDNPAGQHVTYFEAAPFLAVHRFAVLMQDDRGRFHARVFPKVQWDGKAIKEMFERATADTIDFVVTAYPSSDCVGPNGFNSDRYDLDSV